MDSITIHKAIYITSIGNLMTFKPPIGMEKLSMISSTAQYEKTYTFH